MPIRILIIYPTFPEGDKIGGVETFLKGFIKYAPNDFIFEFIGICSEISKCKPKQWTCLKFGNKSINFFPLFLERNENEKKFFPLSLKFTMLLKFNIPKKVLLKKIILFNRIEPAVIFRKYKIPKIGFIHNDILKQIKGKQSEVLWSRFPSMYFLFEKIVFQSLSLVYSVNQNSLNFYKNRYVNYQEKFYFLPTWVDKEIFFPSLAEKKIFKNNLKVSYNFLTVDCKWILFVGRLSEQKSPLRLIDAFVKYHESNPASILIIIGEGNLKNDILEYIRNKDLAKRVFLFNYFNQSALADFYRAADVLLLVSNFEGMPRSVLEALGSGLPVVTTNVGEVKLVVKNDFSGEVVESYDPKDIAKMLEKVLKRSDMYTKENCVSSISEYTPAKVLEPVYKKIRELYLQSFT